MNDAGVKRLYSAAALVAIIAASSAVFIKARQYFERVEYPVYRVDEIKADTSGFAWKGNVRATRSAVVYTDIECTQYRSFRRLMDTLTAARGDEWKVYYKLRPLFKGRLMHLRTYAAYAAQVQGKFFEMLGLLQDILMPRQRGGDIDKVKSQIDSCAHSLQLDMEQFKRDMNSAIIEKKAEDVIAETEKYGIITFPCLLIKGHLVRGLVPSREVLFLADKSR